MTRRATLAVAVAGGALLLAHALWYRSLFGGLAHDDAYISFRYADHFAAGHGLVYNSGERIEGYSNFLWVLLLTPCVRLWGDPTLAAQILGLGFAVGSLWLVLYCLRRVFGVESTWAAILAVAVVAGSGYFAAWATGGLESALYGCLLLAAWSRYCNEARAGFRTAPVAALLAAAVALTRPEGVPFAVLASVLHVGFAMRRRQPLTARATWLFPAVTLGLVVGYEIWRIAYYGPHLFPNSVRAKFGGGWALVPRGLRYVGANFLWPYFPLVAAMAYAPAARHRRDFAIGCGLLAAPLLVIIAAGGDFAVGRLFAPLVPVAAVLLTVATAGVVEYVSRRRGPAAGGVVAGAVGVWAIVACLVTSPGREMQQWKHFAPIDAERVAIGRWLRDNVPGNSIVAVHAAGEIPYYSRLYAHDMLGLNDAHIAALHMPLMGRGVAGHEKFDPTYTLTKIRPDIIVEGRLIPGLERHAAYLSQYHRVTNFWTYHGVAMRHDFLARLPVPAPAAPTH